jgi:hypothetical protein
VRISEGSCCTSIRGRTSFLNMCTTSDFMEWFSKRIMYSAPAMLARRASSIVRTPGVSPPNTASAASGAAAVESTLVKPGQCFKRDAVAYACSSTGHTWSRQFYVIELCRLQHSSVHAINLSCIIPIWQNTCSLAFEPSLVRSNVGCAICEPLEEL